MHVPVHSAWRLAGGEGFGTRHMILVKASSCMWSPHARPNDKHLAPMRVHQKASY